MEFDVEVIGHFGAIVRVEADSYEEAEELALRDFEKDYSPYSSIHGWTDSWAHTEVEDVQPLEDEVEE